MKISRYFCLTAIIFAAFINKATGQSTDSEWDVMKLFEYSNAGAIVSEYGADNVTTDFEYGFEGIIIGMSLVIYPETRNEISLNKGEGESEFSSISLREPNSQWKTPKNIKVGTTLEDLKKINGEDFKIYHFELDYGGTIETWNGGNLEDAGIYVMLYPNNNSAYNNVIYELANEISSADTLLKNLDVRVTYVSFSREILMTADSSLINKEGFSRKKHADLPSWWEQPYSKYMMNDPRLLEEDELVEYIGGYDPERGEVFFINSTEIVFPNNQVKVEQTGTIINKTLMSGEFTINITWDDNLTTGAYSEGNIYLFKNNELVEQSPLIITSW